MSKILIALGLMGIVFLGIRYFALQQSTVLNTEESTPSPVAQVQPFLQASPDATQLLAGGSSYSDSQGVFGFLYPNDYTIDTQEEGRYTRIYKKGATQKGQTEMYDGVIISFERVDLEGKTLSEWVDDQINQAASNGFATTMPKKEVTLGAYPGFTFAIHSLGTSTTLVVQKAKNSTAAVSVTFLVADPQNKDYQKEVDAIVSTLELRK